MVNLEYKKYLASDKWRRKRQEVFNKYGKKCRACGTMRGPIQVHHLDYSRFGNENLSDLMPLCWSCHTQVTKIYRRNRKRGLRRVTMEFVRQKRASRPSTTKRK